MLASLQDLYRHTHSQVALRRLGSVEKGSHLHTQAALSWRTLVNLSVSPERPVWLDSVAYPGRGIDVGQLAPVTCVSTLQSKLRDVDLSRAHLVVRHETWNSD